MELAVKTYLPQDMKSLDVIQLFGVFDLIVCVILAFCFDADTVTTGPSFIFTGWSIHSAMVILGEVGCVFINVVLVQIATSEVVNLGSTASLAFLFVFDVWILDRLTFSIQLATSAALVITLVAIYLIYTRNQELLADRVGLLEISNNKPEMQNLLPSSFVATRSHSEESSLKQASMAIGSVASTLARRVGPLSHTKRDSNLGFILSISPEKEKT